jgi:hypothetical protein
VLVATGLPAFVASSAIVLLLGHFGVSEVWSFFSITPILIGAWYFLIGCVIDRRRLRHIAAP